jgi:hypothetical protein
MKPWRIGYAAVALLGTLSPVVLAYVVALASTIRVVSGRALESSPNPVDVTEALPGPAEMLVYLDPWWAGVAGYWLAASWVCLAAFVAVVALRWPREPSRRALMTVFRSSIILGAAIAAPYTIAFW